MGASQATGLGGPEGLEPSGLHPADAIPRAERGILWCVHTIGPDDVHAAPDFDTAERWAANVNRQMREYTKASGMENDPYWPETRCVVAVWPWDDASHAEGIPDSIREFTPIILNEANDLEVRAREIEGDSDNPLRVAEANELYAQAAEKRAAYASAIEARRAETENTGSVHESATAESRDAQGDAQ